MVRNNFMHSDTDLNASDRMVSSASPTTEQGSSKNSRNKQAPSITSLSQSRMKKPKSLLRFSKVKGSQKMNKDAMLSTDSFTSSKISVSTPHLGTKDRLAMMALKTATKRQSKIDLRRRRNTDKVNHMFNLTKDRK